jgi:hypothetical protein
MKTSWKRSPEAPHHHVARDPCWPHHLVVRSPRSSFSSWFCRGDDFWGMPRAVLSTSWRPKNLHGARIRRPALPEGPAAPAAGWRLHRGEPEPGDEDKIPPTAVSPKVAWTPTRSTEAKDGSDARHERTPPTCEQEPSP